MRIFVSESICGGAWPGEELPESLAREGRAMLLALIEDAARHPGWELFTTWDRRLVGCPGPHVTALIVDGPEEERSAFDQLVQTSDATYVIAPELDDLLARRCLRVRELGGASLNCTVDAVSICGDKFELSRRLADAGIATPPTHLLGPESRVPPQLPVVVKPRFGAGSYETYQVGTRRRFDELQSRFGHASEYDQAIVQPLVNGTPVSIAAFFDTQGRLTDLCPEVKQELSNDGRFSFLGGMIPANTGCQAAIHCLVQKAAQFVPGLSGYAGFDLVVPERQPFEPVLIEINPRLTTSYVGYRALSTDNLAVRILQPDPSQPSVSWSGDHIHFSSDGRVRRVPQLEPCSQCRRTPPHPD